jgi:hypothetical protein
MESTKTATLKVPGATLYYEVRGAGPVLLMICGGIYDAAALPVSPSGSPTPTRW